MPIKLEKTKADDIKVNELLVLVFGHSRFDTDFHLNEAIFKEWLAENAL